MIIVPAGLTLSGNAYCNTTPPAAPAVFLSWTSSAGGTSYQVYRNGSFYASGITATTFDNNLNVVAGQTYSYFIRAVNANGTTDSNTISVTVPSNVCPQQPGNFTLSGNAYCNTTPPAAPAVFLSWTSSPGGTSYQVYRNGSFYAGGITGTTFDNNLNVVAGQTYSYFIRAVNANGTTDSNTISVTVPSNVCPQQPGNFTLSGNAYCNTTPPAAPAVFLSWTSSAGATSYQVYRNGSFHAGGITGTTFDNNLNVVAGQTYSYFIRAVNANGTTDSNTISVAVPSNVCPQADPDIRIEPLSLAFSASSSLQTALRIGADEEPVFLAASDRAFEVLARDVTTGGRLNVEGLLLYGESGTSTLELQRVAVWRPDSTVMIGSRRVAPPKTVYFRGSVAGHPDSRVVLSVRERGGVMGMVFRSDGGWAIGRKPGEGGLRTRKVDSSKFNKPFECGVLNGLTNLSGLLEDGDALSFLSMDDATVLGEQYVATIAIETDYEYYSKFLSQSNPQAAALDYVADLIGYAGLVFSREIDTDMTIGFVRLWDGGPNTDPWSVTSDTLNALPEFRDYWNANMQSVKRTSAHLLSGKDLGGGRAWIGTLCDNFNRPGSSADYGISADIEANFSWDGNQNPSAVVWDIYVVSHELGHSFGSPHSHDYCGIGGSTEPIDRCAENEDPEESCGPPIGLPTCSSPTPFFDGGAGTIMSYCHQQQPGGVGNVAMTFGEGHTCGILPGRQAERMSAHVAGRASAFPACFTAPGTSFTITNDGPGELVVSELALQTPAPWISWTTATLAPFTISEGGSEVVTVSVDFSLAPPGQTTSRILVSSNDPDESPYPGGVNIVVNQEPGPVCYSLSRTHMGSGTAPSSSPTSSPGCPTGQYTAGTLIQLTTSPAAGWTVESWTGTLDDNSISTTNTLSMPASNHTVTVNYTQVPSVCYSLLRSHTGAGADPSASPTGSIGCPSGEYTAGASIQVTANPAAGWTVGSWTGTVDDGSTAVTNTVIMPASDQTVAINYVAAMIFADGFETGDLSRWSRQRGLHAPVPGVVAAEEVSDEPSGGRGGDR